MTAHSKVYYDQKENVIVIDHTGMTVTREVLEKSGVEVAAIGKTLSEKVYQVVCWTNATIDTSITDEVYLAVMETVNPYIKGTVRYGVTDPFVNITARSFSVRHKVHGIKSNIYPTKEEAFAAVRTLREQEKISPPAKSS